MLNIEESNMRNFECYSLNMDLIIMQKYDLNPTEWTVTKALMLYQDGEMGYFSTLLQLDINVKEVLKSLFTKGIIKKSEKFDPGSIEINKVKFKAFYRGSFALGRELFSKYPMFGNINGVITSLRGISKRFASLEEFYSFYGKEINWRPDIHAHIIELLEWEVSSGIHYLNMSISSFVIEHKWEELEVLRNRGIGYVDMFESL